MLPPRKLPTVAKQLATCAAFCALAVAITAILHPPALFRAWQGGLAVHHQLAVALVFALLAYVVAMAVFRIPRLRNAVTIPPALHGLEISGTKPLSIGLAAGLGEELLFRGALQPLLGLWLASALFAAAHIRTATLAGSTAKKVVYMASVFVAGVGLGFVFEYVGLLAAILLHATIDAAALLSLRKLRSLSLAPQAT